MYAQVLGSTTFGLNGHVIGVEVDINKNFPSFDIVGLPTTAVKESKERVHSAIRNSGYHFPVDKVTVNLAPADLKKDGSGLDLPIAVGLLAASGDVAKKHSKGSCSSESFRSRERSARSPAFSPWCLPDVKRGFPNLSWPKR